MDRILQNGDQLDKYRIEYCLGTGGMGEVYLATHVYLNVQRAIKILRMDLTADDPAFRERFIREARMAARFQHPNSIEVVDVETSSASGFLYLVMEYVDGQTLEQYMQQNGVIDEAQALYICREAACALDAAWKELRLVHRDIKPGNIMISHDGEVKLADLGIAKSAGGSGATMTLTMAGTMIGTPEYASPEQCRDAGTVDSRADIYSLGAMMYEMLTGVRPFSGATPFDTLVKVLQEPLVPIRQRNPNITHGIAVLVERMMAKDPADRPQSMSELITLLDTLQKMKGSKTAVVDRTAEVESQIRREATVTAKQKAQTYTNPMEKKRNREYVLLILMIVLTVLLGGMHYDLYLKRQKAAAYNEKVNREQQAKQQALQKRKLALVHDSLKKPGIILTHSGNSIQHFNPENPEMDYHVPHGVRQIRTGAFEQCHNLQNVYCPDTLFVIDADAFKDCRNLKTISVPRYCRVYQKTLPNNAQLIRRRR